MKLIPITAQVEQAEADLTMYRNAAGGMEQRGYSKEYCAAKIAVQEAIVHTLKMLLPPKGVTQGTLPVVLHFATEADRAAYIKEAGL